VSPNVAEYVENTDLPGDGYGAIQNLKRAYLDSATVTNGEKLAELMKFSKWFPDIENPQITLAKLQTLNLILDPAHRHNDPTLSMITVGALKVNANYTPLVTSLQTTGQLDTAEVIKLTTWVIKHWNYNNKTFKGNKDRTTFNKQTENAIKKINGKLFTVQSHSQAGAGGGTKRKFGNKGGNNKNRPDKPEPKCVTCGGSHLAQHCSKNEGKITCNTCGGPHKNNACPKNPNKYVPGGGKRARSYTNIKNNTPKNDDVCGVCTRQGHATDECHAKPCPKCKSKLFHGNWNGCNGVAPIVPRALEPDDDDDEERTGRSSFLLQGASAYDLSTTLRNFFENENENHENIIVYLANELKLTAIHTGEGFPAAQKALALVRNSLKSFKASAPNESNANSHTDQIVPPSEAQPALADAADSEDDAWSAYAAVKQEDDDLLCGLNG